MKSGKIITPEAERDFKLISLVLSMEYYFFLLIGLLTVSAPTRNHLTILNKAVNFQNNSIFYMPFLGLYALIISLEFVVFLTRMFIDGLNLRKRALLMTIFMMYNWSSVACTFARSMSCCDL